MFDEEESVEHDKSEAGLHTELEDLRNLVRSDGWGTLVAILNEMIRTRKMDTLIDSVVRGDGDYMQNILINEYEKGFLKALVTVAALPNTRILDLMNQLGLDKPEKDDDNGT